MTGVARDEAHLAARLIEMEKHQNDINGKVVGVMLALPGRRIESRLPRRERMFQKSSCQLPVRFGVALLLVLPVASADPDQPLLDGGFELQHSATISGPWRTEGNGFKGIDLNKGLAHSGKNNAFIRTTAKEWNAITQFVLTKPLVNYGAEAFLRTSGNVHDGYFGIRDEVGRVITEVKFGPLPAYTKVQFAFKGLPRQTGVKVFIGYWAQGQDSWLQIDGVNIGKTVIIDQP